MKIDYGFGVEKNKNTPEAIIAGFRAIEEQGFDSAQVSELSRDPFLELSLATAATHNIELRTAITVAFSRSPMNMAYLAHGIQALSQGRFTLGLGSQIKLHITKRFGMPWGAPAAQMRDYIGALKAIWNCWYEGESLDYQSEHYQHTLMTPEFIPEDTTYGAPSITVAAVGPKMTEVAVKEGDGLILHGFTTEAYVRQCTLPLVEAALVEARKVRQDVEVCLNPMIVTGETEEELAANKQEMKARIAFYASTPNYRGVLDVHGWGDLQPELNKMSKAGQWQEMARLIDDTMLDTFAAVGEPLEVASKLKQRYGGIVDRISIWMKIPEDSVEDFLLILRRR